MDSLIIKEKKLAKLPTLLYQQICDFQLEWNQYIIRNCTIEKLKELLLHDNVDPFIKQLSRLVDMDPCPIKAALLRNDYFLTEEEEEEDIEEMKMVEYNTMAVSLYSVAQEAFFLYQGEYNQPLTELITFLKKVMSMHQHYYNSNEANILMIITDQDAENGNVDQEKIAQLMGDPCHRITLNDSGLSRRNNGHLYFKDKLINVVYFRAAYLPFERGVGEWENRKLIESSLACKINSINVQLMGMKVVQMNLNKKNSDDVPHQYRKLQVEMKPIGSFQPADSGKFILKSNKEGGNSCIFDKVEETVEMITKQNQQMSNWLLMERIRPKVTAGLTNEIGIYGGVIYDLVAKIFSYNKVLGYLVRSKPKQVNESGVNAGFAKVNSLILE